jgi:hypothetical protein
MNNIRQVKGASGCRDKNPAEVLGKDGKPLPAEILKAGDCGWAYLKEQTNTSLVRRPLMVSAYDPRSKGFEKKLFGGNLIIARINGSVVAATIAAERKASAQGEDPLSPTNDHGKDRITTPILRARSPRDHRPW